MSEREIEQEAVAVSANKEAMQTNRAAQTASEAAAQAGAASGSGGPTASPGISPQKTIEPAHTMDDEQNSNVTERDNGFIEDDRPASASLTHAPTPSAASPSAEHPAPAPARTVPAPPPPETKEQLRAAMLEIEKWEKGQKDIWFFEKLGRIPFMLLDKLTPKFLQQKIGQALDEVGSYVQTGGRYLISEREILRKMQVPSIGDAAAMPLQTMDAVAAGLASSRKTLATMQGATTGFGGIFTLAVDVPALLGLSLKIIQEIAICYGYDPKLKEERIFAVKCLQFASSDIVGKKAILDELSLYGRKKSHDQMASQLQGWREVIMVYRDNYGWKKLFQLIPVAGMIFGAFINRGTLQDVAEAATMLYRKRRVMERLDQLG